MNRRWVLAAFGALVVACGIGACAPDSRRTARPSIEPITIAAIQRAALSTLFLERERAQGLVFWDGPRAQAPTLSLVAPRGDGTDALPLLVPDLVALSLPVPATVVRLADLEAHFRTYPDGWPAWFARFPASGGLIELTAPDIAPDRPTEARLLVARTCGEHCHQVWRVRVRRDDTGTWRTHDVLALAMPKA